MTKQLNEGKIKQTAQEERLKVMRKGAKGVDREFLDKFNRAMNARVLQQEEEGYKNSKVQIDALEKQITEIRTIVGENNG